MGQKIIHLVRHGHYASSEATADRFEGSLTDLGREQAALTAQRLRHFPINRIHYSSMRRAAETANIIATAFSEVTLHSSELLWEFRWWTVFTDITQTVSAEELERSEQTKQRIETAFQQYFTPSAIETEQHEILVCHGNIIRYFICRVLQISVEALSSMESANCGISSLAIEPNGRLMLLAYNDVGHLPIAKQTFIRHIPASVPLAVH